MGFTKKDNNLNSSHINIYEARKAKDNTWHDYMLYHCWKVNKDQSLHLMSKVLAV